MLCHLFLDKGLPCFVIMFQLLEIKRESVLVISGPGFSLWPATWQNGLFVMASLFVTQSSIHLPTTRPRQGAREGMKEVGKEDER